MFVLENDIWMNESLKKESENEARSRKKGEVSNGEHPFDRFISVTECGCDNGERAEKENQYSNWRHLEIHSRMIFALLISCNQPKFRGINFYRYVYENDF